MGTCGPSPKPPTHTHPPAHNHVTPLRLRLFVLRVTAKHRSRLLPFIVRSILCSFFAFFFIDCVCCRRRRRLVSVTSPLAVAGRGRYPKVPPRVELESPSQLDDDEVGPAVAV